MPQDDAPRHGTKAGTPAEDATHPPSRDDLSTMVSGGQRRRVGPSPDLFHAAAPPRPPQVSSRGNLESGRVRPSSFAEGLNLAEDFEDDTPASKPVLLPEQVGPLPPSSAGSVRMSLTGSGRNLRGVRVALVDVDPTRTDALAVALRARQAEVHVSSLEAERVHMRLLRKFSPHAVLIDEEVLSSAGRDFVAKLRKDPFLSHTQLFALRFDRMYRTRVGVASIETVREFLEPLGRAENELLARLGPHVEVEFELDQFPPHRLLKMLATRAAPTTIQCTREKEMLRLNVVRGRTGHAQLYRLGVDEPERLSADEAFDWLLGHQNCHVVLTQPTEFDEKTGREVIPMVERQESGLWAMPNRKRTPAASPADSLSPFALGRTNRRTSPVRDPRRSSSSRWNAVPWWKLPAAVGLGALVAIALGKSGVFRLGEPPAPSGARPSSVAMVDADAPSARRPASRPEENNGLSERPEQGVDGGPKEPTSAGSTTVESDSSGKDAADVGLLSVPAERLTSCPDLVGEFSAPHSVTSEAQVARLSNQYFRAAQKALVGGYNDKAHLDMCRAALLHPSGPGTLLLVQYVLARRDYDQALHWMKQVREVRPDDLEVQELWGDVLHQSGQTEQALGVWLRALSMKVDEKAKRTAVARRWVAHAEHSLSGGDLPRAERALRRARSFDANSALAARLLAVVFERQGRGDLARRWRDEEARLVELR